MHELVITESILKQALNEAQKVNAKAIKKIKLKIGEATTVLPDCVEFYFNIIKEKTIANDCKLEIETVPLKVQCPKCKKTVKTPQILLDNYLLRKRHLINTKPVIWEYNNSNAWQFSCRCRQGIEIVAGQEILIDFIDVDV